MHLIEQDLLEKRLQDWKNACSGMSASHLKMPHRQGVHKKPQKFKKMQLSINKAKIELDSFMKYSSLQEKEQRREDMVLLATQQAIVEANHIAQHKISAQTQHKRTKQNQLASSTFFQYKSKILQLDSITLKHSQFQKHNQRGGSHRYRQDNSNQNHITSNTTTITTFTPNNGPQQLQSIDKITLDKLRRRIIERQSMNIHEKMEQINDPKNTLGIVTDHYLIKDQKDIQTKSEAHLRKSQLVNPFGKKKYSLNPQIQSYDKIGLPALVSHQEQQIYCQPAFLNDESTIQSFSLNSTNYNDDKKKLQNLKYFKGALSLPEIKSGSNSPLYKKINFIVNQVNIIREQEAYNTIT